MIEKILTSDAVYVGELALSNAALLLVIILLLALVYIIFWGMRYILSG